MTLSLSLLIHPPRPPKHPRPLLIIFLVLLLLINCYLPLHFVATIQRRMVDDLRQLGRSRVLDQSRMVLPRLGKLQFLFTRLGMPILVPPLQIRQQRRMVRLWIGILCLILKKGDMEGYTQ